MPYEAISDARGKLQAVRDKSDAIIVFFSGGKDSLCVLDLCSKMFDRVVCVFMYFVPGLKSVEKFIQYGVDRYKVELLKYPHWAAVRSLKFGLYCTNNNSRDDWPELKSKDIYSLAMIETGIKFIATGAKWVDSQWRRRNLAITENYGFLITPIVNWNRYDVFHYMKKNGIPIPEQETSRSAANGIDLSATSVLALHDKYPEDFQQLLKYFPFAEAIVKRRDWYGVK